MLDSLPDFNLHPGEPHLDVSMLDFAIHLALIIFAIYYSHSNNKVDSEPFGTVDYDLASLFSAYLYRFYLYPAIPGMESGEDFDRETELEAALETMRQKSPPVATLLEEMLTSDTPQVKETLEEFRELTRGLSPTVSGAMTLNDFTKMSSADIARWSDYMQSLSSDELTTFLQLAVGILSNDQPMIFDVMNLDRLARGNRAVK